MPWLVRDVHHQYGTWLILPRQKARLLPIQSRTHSVYDIYIYKYKHVLCLRKTRLIQDMTCLVPSFRIWHAFINVWHPLSIQDMTHLTTPKRTSSPCKRQDSFSIWYALFHTWHPSSIQDMTYCATDSFSMIGWRCFYDFIRNSLVWGGYD